MFDLSTEGTSREREIVELQTGWTAATDLLSAANVGLSVVTLSLRMAQSELALAERAWADGQSLVIEQAAKIYQADARGTISQERAFFGSMPTGMTLFGPATPAASLAQVVAAQASELARFKQDLVKARDRVAALAGLRKQRQASVAQATVARDAAARSLAAAKDRAAAIGARLVAVKQEQKAVAQREKVVMIAKQYLGTRYVWGGAAPGGFDCSGLTLYVYAQLGVELPHHAASQYELGTYVDTDQLLPGDLVFFGVPRNHVGIYVGDGEMLDAPNHNSVVRIEPLWPSLSGARRIF
jgi:cell wall-associated NlpC family hydrolase